MADVQRRVVLRPGADPVELFVQCGLGAGGDRPGDGAGGDGGLLRVGGGGRGVLFHDDVGVGAADAEG
ncbi:hypothetical protein GCM10010321_08690 [Streptomyces chartreusis]|nr:hypothetical protein GCM10010321_08690 [Streptomyces chartreusis]